MDMVRVACALLAALFIGVIILRRKKQNAD
jgi:hypothetical protein